VETKVVRLVAYRYNSHELCVLTASTLLFCNE